MVDRYKLINIMDNDGNNQPDMCPIRWIEKGTHAWDTPWPILHPCCHFVTLCIPCCVPVVIIELSACLFASLLSFWSSAHPYLCPFCYVGALHVHILCIYCHFESLCVTICVHVVILEEDWRHTDNYYIDK